MNRDGNFDLRCLGAGHARDDGIDELLLELEA
jgi:hypothetical protein